MLPNVKSFLGLLKAFPITKGLKTDLFDLKTSLTLKLIKNQKNEPILSRERQINIIKNILLELKSVDSNETLDIQAFKYREATRLSLEINKKFDIESILDIIFEDFCIGK